MSIAAGHPLPDVVLSGSALRRGAQRALSEGLRVADLRADAAGHGLLDTAARLVSSGMAGVFVDDEEDARRLNALDIPVIVDTVSLASPELLFGLPLTPVMSLRGRVLNVKPLRAGEGVSYGYTHRAAADTRVALVSGGYAQGLVRALGNRSRAEVAGRLRPIVGRIAMDACVIDIGDEDIDVGEEVTFFGGDGPSSAGLTAWSTATGLSGLELVTVIGQRVHRIWEE